MKSHESKRNRNKTMSKRRGKTKDDKKNQIDKRRKYNKTLRKKRKGAEKNLTEDNKKEGTEDQYSGT
jgi:hypothetical protein